MGEKQQESRDHWSSQTYSASASFVPNLASQIISWLDPQPTDRILDIGCGDAKFTAHFIPALSSSAGEIYGVDSSRQFINDATTNYARDTNPKISFGVVDARDLRQDERCTNESWDKVVSNAALHWILATGSDAAHRVDIIRSIYTCLKPGGKFVFEFGGAGNVAEVSSVVVALLRRDGFEPHQIKNEIMPWFFPDATWMKAVLEQVGFQVDECELVDRPTRLNQISKDEAGNVIGGGVEGWVRLMLAPVIDAYVAKKGEQMRDSFVSEVVQAVEYVADRGYDDKGEGGMWLRYVRLRGTATKA